MDQDPHPAERERLRTAVSEMVNAFVSREATAGQLTTWAEVVERFTRQIEGCPPESVLWGIGSRAIFGAAAILTPAGYVGPRGETGDTVTASVTFGAEQEGHRGFAHGGVIAQTFDSVLGMFDTAGAGRRFTRELDVRFLKLVPLNEPVTFEGRILATEGPRTRIHVRACIGEAVYAEAEGVMVTKQSAPQ